MRLCTHLHVYTHTHRLGASSSSPSARLLLQWRQPNERIFCLSFRVRGGNCNFSFASFDVTFPIATLHLHIPTPLRTRLLVYSSHCAQPPRFLRTSVLASSPFAYLDEWHVCRSSIRTSDIAHFALPIILTVESTLVGAYMNVIVFGLCADLFALWVGVALRRAPYLY
jgi:hypothetical protein